MSLTVSDEVASPDWPDRPHLTDSRQIAWSRITASPDAHRIIERLLSELDELAVRTRARQPDDARRIKATLAAMAVAPQEVLAWLGPAIEPAAFEVGTGSTKRCRWIFL